MRLCYFGGPSWEGVELRVHGRGQEALLFRLALDAGTLVTYRALAEDVWPQDAPDDARGALQSLVSRLRRTLGADVILSASGGYRLNLARTDIDLTQFQDLAAQARTTRSAVDAEHALSLWVGDPWIPEGADWALRDLLEDRANLLRIAEDGTERVSRSAPTSEVPAPLTSLVGRTRELELVAAQLAGNRLVTLLGPGGAGKTTVSLHTARAAADAVFVELAPASADEVWSALSGAVGRAIRLGEPSRNRSSATDRDRVIEALQGRDVLLVLDNCEHVRDAAAAVVMDVLAVLPNARALATSREPLGVPGEAFVDLGPLPAADAMELFDQRVRSSRGEAISADERGTATRIVRRLDGLPLAVELAAAKSRTLSLEEIDEGLDDRFTLLENGPRAADPRHQTLRALIDWSWEPLPEPERVALLAVSVFPDGVGATDVAAVAAGFETDRGAFERLVDRSLLVRVDRRFRALETVREYALERLRERGTEHQARLAAAEVLADLALHHDPQLRGPRVREALAWFDANTESLSAGLRAALSNDAHDTAVRLVRAEVWPAMMRERLEELQADIASVARSEGIPGSEPAVVVDGLHLLLALLHSSEDAVPPQELERFAQRASDIDAGAKRYPSELSLAVAGLAESSVASLRAIGKRRASWSVILQNEDEADLPAWTQALFAVLRAAAAQNNGDVRVLGEQSEAALTMFRQLQDPWGVALASQMRSEWLMLQGQLEEALAVSDAAVTALEGLTSVWDVIQQSSMTLGILIRLARFDEATERLNRLGELAQRDGSSRSLYAFHTAATALALASGEPAEALVHMQEMERNGTRGPQPQISAWIAARRATAQLMLGDARAARDSVKQALTPAFASMDHPVIADVLLVVALLLVEAADFDAARRVFAASVRTRGGVDATEPVYAQLRAELGEPDIGLPLTPDHADTAERDDDAEVIAAFLD